MNPNSMCFRRLIWLLAIFIMSISCQKQVDKYASTRDKKEAVGRTFRIGVTQIVTHPGIDAVRKGFMEQMEREGYRGEVNTAYDFQNANGDFTASQAIAKRFANSNLDLIFSISTPSTQACIQAIGGKIPIVFGAITDPVSAGIVNSLTRPGGNITGTTDLWPYAAQFKLLKQVVPNAKKVGVLFNPAESNAQASMKLTRSAAANENLTLIEVAANSTNEVPAAARSLVGKVDAIYIPADNTVISAIAAVVGVAERNHIPLMPGDSSNVEVGGFGTIGHDYAAIGAESARLAARILRGERAGNIPVSTGTVYKYYFNVRSAKLQGVSIPEELLKKADVVYGRPE